MFFRETSAPKDIFRLVTSMLRSMHRDCVLALAINTRDALVHASRQTLDRARGVKCSAAIEATFSGTTSLGGRAASTRSLQLAVLFLKYFLDFRGFEGSKVTESQFLTWGVEKKLPSLTREVGKRGSNTIEREKKVILKS